MIPDIIGQRSLVQLLAGLVAAERLPAAVLLTGPPGIGKQTLARAVACLLFGLSKEPEGHPDFLRFTLREEGGLRDRLVSLLPLMHQRPVSAPKRVLLLTEIDRLSPASASLLLKAIEDAPPSAQFLLTGRVRERIPETVRSRCLTRELHPLSDSDLATALAARGISAAQCPELTRLAGGRPGLALRLAGDETLAAQYRTWEKLISAQLAADERTIAVSTLEGSERTEEFLVYFQSQFRHTLPSVAVLRRAREAAAMIRQHVPVSLVIEYALARA